MKTVNTPAGPVKVGDVVDIRFSCFVAELEVKGFDGNWILFDFGNKTFDPISPNRVASVRMVAGTRIA